MLESMSSKELNRILDRVEMPNELQNKVEKALAEAMEREYRASQIFNKGAQQHQDIIKQLVKTVKSQGEFDPDLKNNAQQLTEMIGKGNPWEQGLDFEDLEKMHLSTRKVT